jgi:hypothetical protein
MLEVTLRVAQRVGVFQSHERLTSGEPFYQDSNPRWGIWHPPHARFRARGDCFEEVYESNSWGARDRERSLDSDRPRVVVLGDSFVEGVGAALGRRMTDLLEARTGVEHLNFGVAGNFSSVQQWLLYEELASRFDHELVLLFHFPNNDFLENDPERFWANHRYRPYLRRDADGSFSLHYPVDFESARARERRQLWWNRWYNALFVYRFGSWLGDQILARRALAKGETTELGYVGYVNYTELDLERLFASYRGLRDAAGGRELVIFSLPRQSELEYARSRDVSGALPKRLREFAEQEPRIRYADLLPGFLADAQASGRALGDYFIPCDGHWSALGNELAAELVLQHVDPRALRKRAE